MATKKSPLFRHFRRRPGVFAGENSPVPHSVPCFSPFRNRQGVALVIVLAFVVLLTGVVVAYFARSMADRQLSNSSFNQAKADEMARSALDVITGDLKQEIVNGSTIQNPQPGTYPDVYLSSSNAYRVPVKNNVPTTWTVNSTKNTTLLRISGTGTGTFGTVGVDHPASAALSTGTSANGRSITMARWNKHYLMPLKNFNTPTDTTPDASATAPSWVYVTGTGGPTVLQAPLPSVVGRYAYAVYDEGALLDVNVAGYPLDPTPAVPPMPSQYAPKGALAFADLTALNFFGSGRSPTQAGINALVGWRNYASMRNATANAFPSGAFPTLAFSGATFLSPYKTLMTSNPSGFMKVSGSSSGSMTDQAFLTRQELINLVQAINPTGTSNFNWNMLQFLGTFSRAVTAPSWKPTATIGTPSGNTIDYAGQAETSGAANRDLANVRFTTSGSVTHYNDGIISGSGTMISQPTSSTYAVNAGDPLMQSRFSLAKIAWLSQADPDTGTAPSSAYATAIQTCFGLKWGAVGAANGGNACWSYVGSPGSAFSGKIKTLAEVAAETPPREPNFFELLKASILSGSLGQNPGKCVFDNGNDSSSAYDLHQSTNNVGVSGFYAYSFDRQGTIPAPCQISDMQIMQIGADIIDQYDADSYPTPIYFHYNGISPTYDAAMYGSGTPIDPDHQIYGADGMVYGDENLPELIGFKNPSCTVDGKPYGTTPGYTGYSSTNTGYGATEGFSMWWQPEIWNPHQMPNPANSSVSPPQKFQIRGYGAIKFHWDTNIDPNPNNYPLHGDSNPQTMDGVQRIDFTDTSPATSAFYAKPELLTQNLLPNIIATTSLPDMSANNRMDDYTINPFVGFWSGNDPTYYGSQSFVNVTNKTVVPPTASFCLGWLDSSSGFHPYSYNTGLFSYTYGVVNNHQVLPAGHATPLDISANMYLTADPRTQRFSGMNSWTSGWPFFPTPASTIFPDATHRLNGQTMWVIPNPASNAAFVYDPQGGYNEFNWLVNSTNPSPLTSAINFPIPYKTYYSDPDGVVRPGDGVFGNARTGDGMLLFTVAGTNPGTSPRTASGDNPYYPTANGNTTGNTYHGRRPVILNRPFRSVGELGYTFRDLPFKSLDFFSKSSADAALLDVFSVNDQSRIAGNQLNVVCAGQVNLSNAPWPVIQAILSGGSKKDFDAAYNFSASAARPLAQAVATELNPASGSGPLANRADLVTRLGADPTTAVGAIRSGLSSSLPDQNNKAYLESPVRALADVTNTRTWNLMIDVIAQAGSFTPNAPNNAAALNTSFNVTGERRYWLHVAIDRFTGKIVDEQLESVYE